MLSFDWKILNHEGEQSKCSYKSSLRCRGRSTFNEVMANNFRLNKDDADVSLGDEEEDDVINDEQDKEHELDPSTVIGQSTSTVDDNEVKSSLLEINQQQIAAMMEKQKVNNFRIGCRLQNRRFGGLKQLEKHLIALQTTPWWP